MPAQKILRGANDQPNERENPRGRVKIVEKLAGENDPGELWKIGGKNQPRPAPGSR